MYTFLFAWWCLTPLSTIFQLYRGGCIPASILITTQLWLVFFFSIFWM